jgi:hypothetical protein
VEAGDLDRADQAEAGEQPVGDAGEGVRCLNDPIRDKPSIALRARSEPEATLLAFMSALL